MIHPDDASELQEIAGELGGAAIRGTLRYPSRTGYWQVGETELEDWLEPFRGQEVVLVAASIGEGSPELIVCGVCGFEYDVVGPCPRCERLNQEEAHQMREALRRRRAEIDALLEDIEDFLSAQE